MRTAIFTSIRRLYACRTILLSLIALVIVSGFTFHGWLRNRPGTERSVHAHLSVARVAAQAQQVCAIYGGGCDTMNKPVLLSIYCEVNGRQAVVHRWFVECQKDKKEFTMLFDDNTGRLNYLNVGSLSASELSAASRSILTRREAIYAGLNALKSLDLAPAGTRLALRTLPIRENASQVWAMIWCVRSHTQPSPHLFRVSLNSYDGMPVRVRELRPERLLMTL